MPDIHINNQKEYIYNDWVVKINIAEIYFQKSSSTPLIQNLKKFAKILQNSEKKKFKIAPIPIFLNLVKGNNSTISSSFKVSIT